MCTSLAPGFYLRDEDNFRQFKEQIMAMKTHFKEDCIFSIFEKTPAFMREDPVNNAPRKSKQPHVEKGKLQ